MKLFEFIHKKFFIFSAIYFFTLLVLVRFIYNANLLLVPLGILGLLEIATAISVFLLFYESKAGVYVKHLRFILSILLLLSTVSFFPLYAVSNPFLEDTFAWDFTNAYTILLINIIYNTIAVLMALSQVGKWKKYELLRTTFISIAMLLDIVLCILVFIYVISWSTVKEIPSQVMVYIVVSVYAIFFFLKAKKQELDYRMLVIISYWMALFGGVVAPTLANVMWEIEDLIWNSLVGIPLVVSILSLKWEEGGKK